MPWSILNAQGWSILGAHQQTTAAKATEATPNSKGLTPELSRAEGVGLNDLLGPSVACHGEQSYEGRNH
jgi:hypothetical protein